MRTVYRTALVIDDKRHDVLNLVLCSYDVDSHDVVVLPGFSTNRLTLANQLHAFEVEPLCLIILSKCATVKDGVKIFGNGELGGLTIDGDVEMCPPKVMFLEDYGPSGTHRLGTGPHSDTNVNLTLGCCIRINAFFEEHGWPIRFHDDYVMRNRQALKPDGSISGVR